MISVHHKHKPVDGELILARPEPARLFLYISIQNTKLQNSLIAPSVAQRAIRPPQIRPSRADADTKLRMAKRVAGAPARSARVGMGWFLVSHKQKLNICTLEIDEGDCGGDSMSEEPENSTIYYGFNNQTMKCEEFIYEGCGGNDNRFDSINECWRMCYTPLKYFLARVTDYLMHQYNVHPPETSTSSSNSEQKD
ncbi:unnamed protein product [Spodoptera littoralis]|uniref:BPTI/Kunitz inhibitor domain-containing protein n=1 Tax=Spodoptera littoralis TaxID=7109 RepID=A0A9P0N354_SPOLI|nr:unnamed protein product [Spodoptera littoralis]CAH1642992.1 unnamed protein product [Spodoptera littoralis]